MDHSIVLVHSSQLIVDGQNEFILRQSSRIGVDLEMEIDQQVGETIAQLAGHVLRLDGIEQLLLVDVIANDVGRSSVALKAQGSIKCQRLSMELQQLFVFNQFEYVDAPFLFGNVHNQLRDRILTQHGPTSDVGQLE